ncbi:glucosylceramidase [Prevotella sp. A2931]|uniref:Glucosylceramidase n=1 Tax=Prevotella illustrans TaxID=2800387 RepID=A0ABS3M658_9BACT|nr:MULTISPECIES: glycoside hydrolase family 30 beta sandwich domain-containing protein [Prevotella]MBO1363645.1 glucosylceramidase [Prevotella illustrans]PTL26792.1 glucosylceramidase [Prevotella sp. oral taxon 820]
MKKNYMYITTLLLSMTMSALTACGVDSGFDIKPAPEENTLPNPIPPAGEARTFTSMANGYTMFKQGSSALTTGTSMAPTTIQLDPSKEYQTMDGFGFAITYSTCYNLLMMKPEDRVALLKKTYSQTEGYGVSYARISIGCNDFSSTEYTLCDTKGLENFAFYKDETDYVLPILKEILTINPNLKIIAAPWTCPKWMKVKDLRTKAAFDSWTDGHFNPDLRTDYANYFVKFIEKMKAEGINIYAVSPQNEPLNKANCASLYMPWDEEAAFVKELAAAFKKNNLSTKIYVYDHNYDYSNDKEQNDYPIKIYNALGKNFEGSELVVGAAYHDYGGNNEELTDIHNQAADKELIFSESSIGVWNDGRNLGKRLMEDMKNVMFGTVNRWCKAVLVWNLMLDEKMGPNLDGGCQTCYGAIDIYNNYQTLKYNSHYYIICYLSSVVRPGAKRIGTALRSYKSSNLIYSAFINPDGTKAVVMLNAGDNDLNVTISDNNSYFSVKVPAQGVISTTWK